MNTDLRERLTAVQAGREQAATGTASGAGGRRVFVVDDDDVMLLSCRRVLERAGWEVETFRNGRDAIERLAAVSVRPQLVLVDLKMPDLDGFEVIERVRALDAAVVIAVLTGYATVGSAIDAMKAGAYDFLPKPFTPDELRLLADRSLERWNLVAESARLRREKEEAELRFITFVTHELKSPAAAAKQYIDVLLYSGRAELTPRALEWVSRAQARLGEMIRMIEDWLTLSKVRQGSFCNRASTTDLKEAAERVVEETPKPESGVTIVLEAESDVHVAGDPNSIATVIANLVSNAVKYNRPGGRVNVTVSKRDGTGVIEVADTGIGIAPERLPLLFHEFSRIRSEETAGLPGTGLGLAICKRIVTELHGTIDVCSRKGEGSLFVVRIPLAEGETHGAREDGADHR